LAGLGLALAAAIPVFTKLGSTVQSAWLATHPRGSALCVMVRESCRRRDRG
jgi:hypothetical protein